MSEFEPKNGAVTKFQSEKWNQCYLNFTGIIIFISLMISLNGCSSMTLGTDFPVDQVNSIEIGVTTRAEIRERFGAPGGPGLRMECQPGRLAITVTIFQEKGWEGI